MNQPIPSEVLRRLAACDTCSVANAVDACGVRLANEGFSDGRIACRTAGLPPMVGRAVTLKVRSAEPPMKNAFYLDHPDWWDGLEADRIPRVLFIEDVDREPGRGSSVGPVHACILQALGFVGVVTNGAVRGRRKFQEIGLPAFSGNVAAAHAYCHVVATGVPVRIAGLQLNPGDLVHGDEDGIVLIPSDRLNEIARAAATFQDREKRVCEFCGSPDFSPGALKRVAGTDASRR